MLVLTDMNLFFVGDYLSSTQAPVEMQNNTGRQNQTRVDPHYTFILANSSHVGIVVTVDGDKYDAPQLTRDGKELEMIGPHDSFDEATTAAVKYIKSPKG